MCRANPVIPLCVYAIQTTLRAISSALQKVQLDRRTRGIKEKEKEEGDASPASSSDSGQRHYPSSI